MMKAYYVRLFLTLILSLSFSLSAQGQEKNLVIQLELSVISITYLIRCLMMKGSQLVWLLI